MAVKMLKMYFHKPLNASWDELGKRLRDLQWEQHKALNYGMTQFWMWQIKREEVKQETGKYPDNRALPHPAYDNTQPVKIWIKENFPTIPSGTVSSLAMFLKARWSADCKDVFYRGDKSMSTFKRTFPILCSNTQYKLTHDKVNGYVLTVTLAGKKHEGVRRFEIMLSTMRLPGGVKAILDRTITGEYKKGEVKIGYDKRKKMWYANIAYKFTPIEQDVDPDIICGVDLGVAVPFYAAISNAHERLCPRDGMEIFSFRRQIAKRRRSMQGQIRFSSRKGHGRKTALKPLDKLQSKVNNFRDNKYHNYTKAIVDFCIKNNAGTIQLEDLTGMTDKKQMDGFLKDWAIHSFHEKLEYKAKENGIDVVYVNPQYTSQRCSSCGYIDSNNRKTQSDFLCLSCGHKTNADYNAACNLATKNIETIIEESLKQKVAA